MKKLFLLLMTVMLTSAVALAQSRTVTGTVMSAADNEPLPGATVQPVGGGVGVATDIDGNFSLTVPASVKQLTVSYIGMTSQTVNVSDKKMTVKLQSADTKLDEVMVVAYGTSTRQAFTGSASVVGAAEIEQAQVTNVLNALTGKAPGVQIFNTSGQPGSGPSNVLIRGISSISAGREPLYVLDGVPYGGSITNLNPQDIESMTVSKDAAANALYGARGANGVIFITTKSGKSGQQGTVTFDAKWGSNSRGTQLYNTIQDPALYYETYYQALNNYAMAQGMTPQQANAYVNNNIISNSTMGLGYQIYNVPEGQQFIGMNGKINPNATLGRIINYGGEDYYIINDDWMAETYRPSLRQEYNLSVSNSTDRSNFYASFGWLSNEGIIRNTDYKRLTARLKADTQVKPWMRVSGDMSYAHYNNNAMGSDGSATLVNNPLAIATSIAPIYPVYLRNGQKQIMTNVDGMTIYDYGTGENAGLRRPAGASFNANGLSDSRYDTNNAKGNLLNATGILEIRFLKDFKFTSKNNVYVANSRSIYIGNPFFGSSADQGGVVSVSSNNYSEYTFQQLLNYNHQFGDHNVAALFGHENSWNKSAYLGASRSNMFLPNVGELANAVKDQSMDSYTSAVDYEGWFFQAQYDYQSKYFGSFSYRRDASSIFDPKHRWGNFWSVGGGWIISKENFFHADWVDMLKFKLSYGEQGNDNIGQYRYTNRYSVVNVDGQPALEASSVRGNPNITWESTGTINTGFDFDLFNSRLSGNIDYFYRKTTGMLYQKPLNASSGYSNQYENFGDMMNTGVEVALDGVIITNKDLTWSANLNLTWYKNRIVRLPETNKATTVEGYEGTASAGYFQGEHLPMYTWYCFKFAGVDQQTGEGLYYKDVVDADGNVTGQETVTYKNDPTRYLCGTALPSVYGGFGTSLQYRGFDFNIDFAYSLGGKCMDSNYQSYMMTPYAQTQGGAFHADVLKSWTPENPSNTIPRWQFGDQDISTSDRYLTDASYLSLQNINLGYTLPKSITSKILVNNLRVYVAAENVWLWSKRQGLDPRQTIQGATSNTYYSPIRTISGGLTVTF